jgi:hypothetical protein
VEAETQLKLWMVLVGCRPNGRNTEQHDVFFGVAHTLEALIPQLQSFWPGVKLHIDAYMCVENVAGYEVNCNDTASTQSDTDQKLFFVNLGGYAPPDFEEYHKKLLIVARDIAEASSIAKEDTFYKSGSRNSSPVRSHIDDKFELDEIIAIQDLLPHARVLLTRSEGNPEDSKPIIGYLPLSKIGAV